tara:strand:- start:5 stop:286 length:282 start_codon:yes stop_codon:yes gene_type:complete
MNELAQTNVQEATPEEAKAKKTGDENVSEGRKERPLENAKLFLQFGGQGAVYFAELRQLYQRSKRVKRMVEIVTLSLQEELQTKERLYSGLNN